MIDILANGVWSVHFDEAVKIKDARGDTIATLAQTFLRGRRSASEVSANAHLIAAAPDLLDALAALVNLNETGGPFGGELYRDRVERAWDAARAAISKATLSPTTNTTLDEQERGAAA